MLRAHRQASKTQPTQHVAHGALSQNHAKMALDLASQVDPSPTHQAVLRKVRASPHPVSHLGQLLGRQTRRRPRRTSIRQPSQALGVVAMHPVTQRLTVHSAKLSSLRSRTTVQDQSQSKHPTRRISVFAPRRRPAKTYGVQLISCDRHRNHQSLRQISAKGNHASEIKGIPYESAAHAVGIRRAPAAPTGGLGSPGLSA